MLIDIIDGIVGKFSSNTRLKGSETVPSPLLFPADLASKIYQGLSTRYPARCFTHHSLSSSWGSITNPNPQMRKLSNLVSDGAHMEVPALNLPPHTVIYVHTYAWVHIYTDLYIKSENRNGIIHEMSV